MSTAPMPADARRFPAVAELARRRRRLRIGVPMLAGMAASIAVWALLPLWRGADAGPAASPMLNADVASAPQSTADVLQAAAFTAPIWRVPPRPVLIASAPPPPPPLRLQLLAITTADSTHAAGAVVIDLERDEPVALTVGGAYRGFTLVSAAGSRIRLQSGAKVLDLPLDAGAPAGSVPPPPPRIEPKGNG
ncbi:hypothetical protein BH11PLA1_BH11PLA1_01480 [soil metagenome]